ncbi:MAG TPA: alanine dehydrogenase [Flavobacteriales bacterium]|nr:alanine dehydrogenase [Flavobacteriales bacterium]
MTDDRNPLLRFAAGNVMLPQEEMLEVGRRSSELQIGIPKETSFQERRVSLVPAAVAVLVNNGHQITVESGAGTNANYQDKDYSDAGATIAYGPEQVYKCDIVLKVAPPTFDEIEMMNQKQKLISALQLTVQQKNFFNHLISKKITGLAFDYIKDRSGIYPVVRSMSEIAGNTSILIAAEYLSTTNNGIGMMLGGISGVPPTEVVIIGSGTVSEFAARAAIGLGAHVKVFDNSLYRLRRIQNDLGQRLFTSIIEPRQLEAALATADVVIGALRAKEGRTPIVVTDEMVSNMKFGSVIVDISIDQGGCFETSQVTNHANPVFKKYGVTHYCVPNVASRVSQTASLALSNIFTPILLDMGEKGGIENYLRMNAGVRNGVYIYNGIITHKYIGETYNIPYKDLDLLIAATQF